jgi:small subunit ribosomal protein S9
VAEKAAAKKQVYLGTGRRKTSVARVRIMDGTGKIAINGRELNDYFTEVKDRNAVINPLDLVEMRGKLDVSINVKGGGFTGQGGACRQGIARALKTMFGGDLPAGTVPAEPAPEDHAGGMVKKLRDSGYLTRDGRMKERKKYGRKAARKSFQFSKR